MSKKDKEDLKKYGYTKLCSTCKLRKLCGQINYPWVAGMSCKMYEKEDKKK